MMLDRKEAVRNGNEGLSRNPNQFIDKSPLIVDAAYMLQDSVGR